MEEIFAFAFNNGIGVFFGVLMWYQANVTLKEQTNALTKVVEIAQKK